MESNLKVTIDPAQADSAINKINASLGNLSNKSIAIFNGLQSSVNGSFGKLGSSTSDTFTKLQFVVGATFSRIRNIVSKEMSAINASISGGFQKSSSQLSKIWSSSTLLSPQITPTIKGGAISAILGVFKGLAESISGLFGNLFTQIFSAVAITSFMDKLIDSTNDFNAFIATMEISTNSSKAAAAEFNYLFELSNNLGVSVTALTRSYSKFSAAVEGTALAGKGAKEIFESIAMVSSVLHVKGYDTERMFYAITQSISKGRVYREEFVGQLAEKLPGAMKVAAESMHYFTKSGTADTARLNKELTDGTINVYKFWLALSQGIKVKYGDSAAIAAELLEANLNRMRNQVTKFFITLGSGAAGSGLINLVKSMANLFEGATQSAAGFGNILAGIFNKLADFVNGITLKNVDAFLSGVALLWQGLSEALFVFVQGVSGLNKSKIDMIDFAEGVSKAFVYLSSAITQVINGIKLIYQISKPAKFIPDGQFEKSNKVSQMPEGPEKDAARKKLTSDLSNQVIGGFKDWAPFLDGPNDKASKKALEAFGKTADDTKASIDRLSASYGVLRKQNNNVSTESVESLKRLAQPIPGTLSDDEINKIFAALDGFDPEKKVKKGKATPADKSKLEFAKLYTNQLKQLNEIEIQQDNALALRPKLFNENSLKMKELIEITPELQRLDEKKKTTLQANAVSIDLNIQKYQELIKTLDILKQSYQDDITFERELSQLKTGGAGRFNSEAIAKQKTEVGGADFELTPDQKFLNITQGRKKDIQDAQIYSQQLINDNRTLIRGYKDQAEAIGLNQFETRKLNVEQSINNQLRLDSNGATADTIKLLTETANVLKGDLIGAMTDFEKLSKSAWAGAQSAINDYLDNAKDAARYTQEVFSTMFKGLEDMLFNFYKTGKLKLGEFISSIKDMVVRQFIKESIVTPLVQALKDVMGEIGKTISGSSGALGSLLGVLSGGGGGLGTLLGVVANGSDKGGAKGGAKGGDILGNASSFLQAGNSIYSAFSGALSSNVGGLVANFAPKLGSAIAGQMLGSSAGLGATVAGSATGIGSMATGIGSLGSAISTALPYVGLAIAAFSVFKSVFGKKKIPRFSTERKGEYDNGVFTGASAGQQYKPLGAEKQLDGLSEQFSSSLGTLLKGFGLDDKISTTSSLFKKRKKSYGDFSATFAGGTVSANTTGKAKNVQDTFARLAEKVLGETLVQAIQSSQLSAGIKKFFDGMVDKAAVADAINTLVGLHSALRDLPEIFNAVRDAIDTTAYKTSIANLKAMFDNTKTYVNLFYTDQEKFAIFTKQIKGQFADLNTALPATRAGFRALVDGIKVVDEATSKQFAGLVALAPAADQYYKALQDAKNATDALVASLKDETSFKTMFDFQRYIGLSNNYGTAFADARIPSYAVGTDYVPNDGLAMIHKGEKITPAKYNNNESDIGELVGEMRELRASMQQNTAQAKRAADVLVNITPNGNAIQTEAYVP